jgi:O-antigen/teichoic acid export membrane protein
MRVRDRILSMATTQLVSAGLGLVYSVLVARGLGPELRGVFFVVQAYFNLASMLVNLSVFTIMTVQLSRGEFGLAEIHSAAVVLSVALGVGGGAVALLVYLQTAHLPGPSLGILVLFFLSMPAVLYKMMWSAIFLGLSRIALLNIFTILDVFLTALGAGTALFVLRAGLNGLLIMLALQAAVTATIGFYLAVRGTRPRWRLSAACIADLLRQGWKQHIAAITSQLYLRADAFILADLLPPAAIGQYAVARGLAERILMALTPISQVMFPLISSSDPARARSYARSTFRQLAGVGILSMVAFVVLTPWVIPLVYGHAYRDAVTSGQILGVAFVMLGTMVPINLWFVGSLRRPGLNALASAVTLILVVTLGYAFAVRAGGLGMAIATLVSFVGSLAFAIWLGNANGLGLRRLVPKASELRSVVSEIRGLVAGSVFGPSGSHPES